jgi:DNA-binding transcriptional MerR regulator
VGYTRQQAARLTACSVAQLDHWDRTQLVVPGAGRSDVTDLHSEDADVGDRSYSFRDLVALRAVRSLLDAGLPLVRIRRALEMLQTTGQDIAGLRLITDGVDVWACRDDGEILDALRHGQLALFLAVDRIAAALEADVRELSNERTSSTDRLRRSDHPAGRG